MSERTAKRLATRLVEPGELLSEEETYGRSHPAFPPLWETAINDLGRRYLRTRERLRNVFIGGLSNQALLVQTPLGLGIVWRLWDDCLQVVPVVLQTDGTVVIQSHVEGANNGFIDRWKLWETGQIPAGVVTVPVQQTATCQFIVNRILTERPPWAH